MSLERRALRTLLLAAALGGVAAQVSAELGQITSDVRSRQITVNFAQSASPAYGGFLVSVSRIRPLPITPIVESVSLPVGTSSYTFSLGAPPPCPRRPSPRPPRRPQPPLPSGRRPRTASSRRLADRAARARTQTEARRRSSRS